MNKMKKVSYLILTAILLALLNYFQILKELNHYRRDLGINLPKTALFNRIFIHTDFQQFDYMGGKNFILLVSPFLFWILAVIICSTFFLSMDRKYYQYVFLRTNNK